MSFLPDEYKVPVSGGNFMKFLDGENCFRVLGSAIIGWEYWTKDNKPVRSKEKWAEVPQDIKVDKDSKVSIKHFWAFPVWNYEAKAVQVLEVTQQTVMNGIKALVDNKKWGDPKTYDITVTRAGEGFDTTYTVMPNPHSEITDEILAACEKKTINLSNLYLSGDPFGKLIDERISKEDRDLDPADITFEAEVNN
jgi:hypothetical protein